MTGGETSLRLTETFLSLQGEGEHAGLLCYFIRTSGCDLRCRWCDTQYSWPSGPKHSIDSIIAGIPDKVSLIQITGGEPLLQKDAVIELMHRLTPAYKVLLETAGHQSLAEVPPEIHIIMDIKLPGSGEADHDFAANLNYLKSTDEIKFVIAGRSDYDTACRWMTDHQLADRCKVLFSPVWGETNPKDLANWIIADRLAVRMQLQQHKYIWGADTKGV